MSEFPLVTCLCLTKNRREFLPKAVECFLKQEYAPRELLIIADSREDVMGLIPPLGDYIRTRIAAGVVGRKRNVGCREAHGEVIALWDDDDYSAPGRLRQQVEQLKQPGKEVTGYHTMKFTDGEDWWQYRGAKSTVIATSLCFKKTWWEKHAFMEWQWGQDEQFAEVAAARKVLAPAEDLDLMYATIHPGNTSRRDTRRNNAFIELPGFEWKEAA